MASPDHDVQMLIAFFQAKYGDTFTQWLWEESAPILAWLHLHPGATDAEITQAWCDRLPLTRRQEACAHLRAYHQPASAQ
jgi:hypothetical protein